MTVIFDCFGVVVEWGSFMVVPQWAELAKVSEGEFREKAGVELERCEAGLISEEELWSRLGKAFSVEPAELKRVLNERFDKMAKLKSDVVEIVKRQKSKVVLSNQLPSHARWCRERGWFDAFDRVFVSFELGARKPAKEAYRKVLGELNVDAKECVFVDDNEENVKAAEALGMRAVKFESAGQLKRELGANRVGF